MRIVLGRLKELLKDKAPADELEYRINRVSERLITSGKWDGQLQIISLVARWGVVTLPPGYRTLQGGKVGGIVRDVTTRYWDFLPGRSDQYGDTIQYFRDTGDNWATLYPLPVGGRGYTSPPDAVISGDGSGATLNSVQTKDGAVSGVTVGDQGSGYTSATIAFTGGGGSGAAATVTVENGKIAGVVMTVGGTLKLTYPGSDSLTVTVYGTDENFMPVSLALQGSGATAANTFVRIDRIHKEKCDVNVTLQHVTSAGEITPLAIMAPGTLETYYRRYIVDQLVCVPVEIVSVLAKVRHVEMDDDQDVVPFANIGAFELGLKALAYESEGDLTLANQYWQSAIDVLNTELGDMKSPDEVGTLRCRYPGRTTPKMSSTM